MKLPLLIIATIDSQETEFEHSVEVTEEEYDFLMRLDKAESGMHLPPWYRGPFPVLPDGFGVDPARPEDRLGMRTDDGFRRRRDDHGRERHRLPCLPTLRI